MSSRAEALLGVRVARLAALTLSLAVFSAGLASLAAGRAGLHAALLSSSLLGFYAAVATGYLGSLARGSRLAEALLLAHSVSYSLAWLSPALYTLGSTLGLAASILASRPPGPRFPALGFTLLYSAGVATGLLTRPGIAGYLAWLLAVPTPAIIVVNSFALVKTYGLDSRLLHGAAIAEALAATAPVLLALGSSLYAYTLAASMLVYTVLLALMVVGAARSPVYRRASGPARSSHRYVLLGEALAPVSTLAVIPSLHDPVLLAHVVSMGYAGIHIAIHAPLMLPPLLGVPAARRYTPTTYALLYAALAARLLGAGGVAIALAAGYVASLVYASFRVRMA